MKKQILVTLLVLLSTIAFSQKEKVLEGDWDNLKGITQYNVVFEYDDLKVNRFETEEDFLKELSKRFEDTNKSKTEETVKEIWFNDRKRRYEPKFIRSFNIRFDENEVVIDVENKQASYTIKVQTTHIVTGITNGTMNKAAKVDAIISIYKNNAPDTILFSAKYTRAQGNNAAPVAIRPGYTVAESYAKLGKEFAQKLKRKVW